MKYIIKSIKNGGESANCHHQNRKDLKTATEKKMRRQKIHSDRMKQHQKIRHQKKFKKFNMLKHKPKQQNIQTANDTERKH